MDGALFERCYLADQESKWIGKSLDEISHQQANERSLRSRNQNRELQSHVDLNTEIEKVVREAEQMTAQTVLPPTKKERNRAAEKEVIRRDEAFILDGPESPLPVQTAEKREKPLHPTTALIKKKAEETYDD